MGKVYFLQAGTEHAVHYAGLGMVELGAERKAGIEKMLAGDEEGAKLKKNLEEMAGAVQTLKAKF